MRRCLSTLTRGSARARAGRGRRGRVVTLEGGRLDPERARTVLFQSSFPRGASAPAVAAALWGKGATARS